MLTASLHLLPLPPTNTHLKGRIALPAGLIVQTLTLHIAEASHSLGLEYGRQVSPSIRC